MSLGELETYQGEFKIDTILNPQITKILCEEPDSSGQFFQLFKDHFERKLKQKLADGFKLMKRCKYKGEKVLP